MSFQLVMDEYEIQKKNYRKNKAEKSEKAAKRRAEQAKKRKEKEKINETKQVSVSPLRMICIKEAV